MRHRAFSGVLGFKGIYNSRCSGFLAWPTFGFKALDLTWECDSSLTCIGVGAPLRLRDHILKYTGGQEALNRHKVRSQHPHILQREL